MILSLPSCRLCQISQFESTEQQRTHFQSTWHLFNLNSQRKGIEPVPESEYEQLRDGGPFIIQIDSID